MTPPLLARIAGDGKTKAEAEIMDGLRIVVHKMGSETGKLVAAVGPSRAWRRASRRAASSGPRPRPWAGAEEVDRSWRKVGGPMPRSWTRPWRREGRR
ncbi:MAG: hypothetical protein WCP70_04200 [Methanothrix sp.]